MNLCKSFIFFSAIFGTSCLTVIRKFKTEESKLDEAVVKILKSCSGNRITVGLAGNFTGTLIKALWSQASCPVTLIDGTSRKTINDPVDPQFRYRLQLFVVTASSSTYLSKILNEIKTSKWWNHMASFFIIDPRISNKSCKNAFEILWSTWKMNLLNAKFLCHHWTNRRLIYTFNPYTNWAPEPWQLDKIYTDKNDHPWTLFVRRYEDNAEENCNNIDFEKANDLGGYEIRVSSTSFGDERINSGRICSGVFEDLICEILFPALNATPKVLIHSSLNSIGYVDDKGNINGILGEVEHGFSDIGLLGRFLTSFTNQTMTYPHYQCEIRCLTQYTGYKSQLSKIRSVIDSKSRFGLYIVCIITVLFFKYSLRQSLTMAHLSTFRIICNSSLPKITDKLGPRIYLGSLFLFALTIQGIYQGLLASLLTKQDPLRNVNNMKDLAELGHIIYGSSTYGLYFDDDNFKGHYVGIKDVTCTDYVKKNSNAACVGNAMVLVYDATKFRLHMSREILGLVYVALPIRPDWPLEKRVNTILTRSVESNRIEYLVDNVTYQAYRLLKFQENQHKDRSAKVLTLKQLGFTFDILGIGLGFASMSFIVEAIRG